MIKKLWDAIHFGKFKSQWRHPQQQENESCARILTRTLFYESRVEPSENGPVLITEKGGLIGGYAFYLMLPVYALLAFGLVTGVVSLLHVILFEAFFIGLFGVLNGWALHLHTQRPELGVEELSLRQVQLG